MFNFFKKKAKPDAPSFSELASYANSDKYFVRVAQFREFDFEGCTIVVIDPNGPRLITMDPWPEAVFLNATGTHTVKEYIEATAKKYDGNVPPGLDSYMINELEKLVYELRIVAFTDTPNALEPQYEKPIPADGK